MLLSHYYFNVNPRKAKTIVYELGCFPRSHNLILAWYPPIEQGNVAKTIIHHATISPIILFSPRISRSPDGAAHGSEGGVEVLQLLGSVARGHKAKEFGGKT